MARFILFPAVLEHKNKGRGVSYKPQKECTIKKELLAKRCTKCNVGGNYRLSPHTL